MKHYLIKNFTLTVGDLGIIVFSIYLSFVLRFQRQVGFTELNPKTIFLSSFVFIFFLYIFGAYDFEAGKKIKAMAVSVFLSCLCASITNAFIYYAIPSIRYGRGLFGLQFVFITSIILFSRVLVLAALQMSHDVRVVVVAPVEEHGVVKELTCNLQGYEILDYVDFDELSKLNKEFIFGNKVETILFSNALDIPEAAQEKILWLKILGIRVVEITSFVEEVLQKIPVAFLKKDWILLVDGFSFFRKTVTQKIKRLMDLSFSFFGLLVTVPFWAILPVLIKLDSDGPVIYRQLRVGRNNKPFWLLKFRTMVKEAEKEGARWAVASDPRTTRVGRILRKVRFDELPQLINIFKGEMSLVGPRPERPEFVERLEKEVPYYALRHTVAPGLTGWAQVKYPYGASVKDALEKLQYDLYYIKNMNFFLDLLIIIKTVRVVLTGRGAR